MKEALQDIRDKLSAGVYKNEEHVRFSLVARVLQELGWDIWNPAEVFTEFVVIPDEDNTRVDIALFSNAYTPAVYVEVKAVGRIQNDVARLERQLRDYNRNNTAAFSIITDGRIWRFYYSQTGGEFSNKWFKVLDLSTDEIEEIEQAFATFLSRAEVSSGDAKKNAEYYLQLSQKQRAMEDVLAQAKRSILEPPYESLPQALVRLVTQKGISITPTEAGQFIGSFEARKQVTDDEPENQPIHLPRRSIRRETNTPQALADVLEVCREVLDKGRTYREATEIVTRRRGLNSPHTVPDACTRRLSTTKMKVNTAKFEYFLAHRDELAKHLAHLYPGHEHTIRDVLNV